MSRKISIATAKVLMRNAKNNGAKCEARAIAELEVIKYNPNLKGTEGGDLVLRDGTHVQVKAHDGQLPGKVTGNLTADALNAIKADASPVWMIWYTDKDYILIDKTELLVVVAKFAEDLVRYNVRDGQKVLRFQCGPRKRNDIFYRNPANKVATKNL